MTRESSAAARLREHPGREVHAGDAARGADGPDEVRQVRARSAGEVHGRVAGAQTERAGGAAVHIATEARRALERAVGRREPVVGAAHGLGTEHVGTIGAAAAATAAKAAVVRTVERRYMMG